MTLGDAERLVWRLSGWRVDQSGVDRLIGALRDHCAAHGAACDCPVHPSAQTHAEGAPGRTCRKCAAHKPLGEFTRDSNSAGGRRTVCRDCDNERRRTARAREAVTRGT